MSIEILVNIAPREIDEALYRHPAVLEAAATKPLMGVCVGMQMLLDHSEEQDTPGLGLIPGKVVRFRAMLIANGKVVKLLQKNDKPPAKLDWRADLGGRSLIEARDEGVVRHEPQQRHAHPAQPEAHRERRGHRRTVRRREEIDDGAIR